MKKITFFTTGFIGFLLFTSCSSIKVISDVDPSVNWSKFKTLEYYGWAEESDKVLTRFDRERIETAFGKEFASRGISVTEKGSGDMIVTLFIVVEQKTTTTATTNNTGGYYGGYYGYGPGYGFNSGNSTTTFDQYDYQVGTLVCDVFDAKEKKLIWEGIATKEISENPQKRETGIPKAVAAIMSKFPVQPSK